MEEKKCECKLNSSNPYSVTQDIIAYEMGIIIILLILIMYIELTSIMFKIDLVYPRQQEINPEQINEPSDSRKADEIVHKDLPL